MLQWVFTHGSLMTAPPFEVARHTPAVVDGWRRTFGHPSVRNWGRHGFPAPTCSLVRGGSVAGVAHLVRPGVIDRIRQREACEPTEVVAMVAGTEVAALTWPMTDHWSAWSARQLAHAAGLNIAHGGGPLGHAGDYLGLVRRALRDHRVADPAVESYARALATLSGPGSDAPGTRRDGWCRGPE